MFPVTSIVPATVTFPTNACVVDTLPIVIPVDDAPIVNNSAVSTDSDVIALDDTFVNDAFDAIIPALVIEVLVDGSLTLDGAEYQSWDSDPSANAWAYDWALAKLNLTKETI